MKISTFGPIWALLGQMRSFPKNPFRLLLSLYSSPQLHAKKNRRDKCAVSKQTINMFIFGPIWARFGQIGPNEKFRKKSIEVTFKPLYSSNFMQKIRKKK